MHRNGADLNVHEIASLYVVATATATATATAMLESVACVFRPVGLLAGRGPGIFIFGSDCYHGV